MPEIPVFATPFGDLFQGYGWENRSISELSTTTAFDTGIDNRDKFFGRRRCVVCGHSAVLEHSHIIPLAESDTTVGPHSSFLMCSALSILVGRSKKPPLGSFRSKERSTRTAERPSHVPHAPEIVRYFFLFHPLHPPGKLVVMIMPTTLLTEAQSRRFVLVNQSNHYDLDQYHGKCIPLNISEWHTPFPSVFIIHEMRVRGFHPFQTAAPINIDTTVWQDWITADAVYNRTTEWFECKPAPSQGPAPAPAPASTSASASTPAPAPASGINHMQMGDAAMNAILQATRDSASWKACELEAKTWTGTAEENTRAYLAIKDQ
jgi:hypothetical protein